MTDRIGCFVATKTETPGRLIRDAGIRAEG
jgi:hypothetical protein